MSDTHCGHECGLTPENWQYKCVVNSDSDFIKRRNKISIIQKEMWDWYKETIKKLQPIDVLFHLGDCIDGFGKKSGGIELITSDMLKQCEIASECIDLVKAKEIYLLHGTGYHCGTDVDYEEIVAKNVKAKKIGSHEWISFSTDKNPIIFDLKHHVGSSTSPYNRGVSVAKDQLWNSLWAEKELQPKANILLRGHVHYDSYIGNSDFLGMTVPGLQWSSHYGSRICKGIVSVGVTVFDLNKDGTYSWNYEIANFKSQKAGIIEI